MGYALEWRIINAADYGHPQRRRRIFLFAYHKTTKYYKTIKALKPLEIINTSGIFAQEFPICNTIEQKEIKKYDFVSGYSDLVTVSNKFKATFENAGFMIDGKAFTVRATPKESKPMLLRDIVEKDGVDSHYYLSTSQQAKYKFLRGSKKIPRTKPNGQKYFFSEGSMSPFDALELPGRTMLTSEGTANRSTHIIKDPNTSKLRILTPIECERLNQFPDNWTNSGMPEKRRYFIMGNALVCGIIEKLSNQIDHIINAEK